MIGYSVCDNDWSAIEWSRLMTGKAKILIKDRACGVMG